MDATRWECQIQEIREGILESRACSSPVSAKQRGVGGLLAISRPLDYGLLTGDFEPPVAASQFLGATRAADVIVGDHPDRFELIPAGFVDGLCDLRKLGVAAWKAYVQQEIHCPGVVLRGFVLNRLPNRLGIEGGELGGLDRHDGSDSLVSAIGVPKTFSCHHSRFESMNDPVYPRFEIRERFRFADADLDRLVAQMLVADPEHGRLPCLLEGLETRIVH